MCCSFLRFDYILSLNTPVRDLAEFLMLLKIEEKNLASFLEANRYSGNEIQLVLQFICKWFVHILRGHTSMFAKFRKSVRVVRQIIFHEIFEFLIKNQ